MAYSNQCHILELESFKKNSVRPSLLYLLLNYFQGQEIMVKFQGKLSKTRKEPGSGAQEFLSQTNNNADVVPKEDRFKFIDGLFALRKSIF